MGQEGNEVLRFADIDAKLLLKNGNYLYTIPFRGETAVLKVYYGDRSTFEYISKTFGNVVMCNQTSFMPKARNRKEHEVMDLWRSKGFRVFDTYDDVTFTDLPEGGYRVFEYAPGVKFVDYFADPAVTQETKMEMWRRFMPLWTRRHMLALEESEPRLIHENGDLKHVMIWKDDLLFFDFEMVFRSRRRVKEFVAREILAYLKSLGKTVGAEAWDTFLAETVKMYPSRDILEYTYNFAFKNPNLVLRAGRWVDRTFKEGAKKPFSKYNVARKIDKFLRTAGSTA